MNKIFLPLITILLMFSITVYPFTVTTSHQHIIVLNEMNPTGRLGILILLDGLSVDVLTQVNTPNIDELASQYKLFVTKTVLPSVTAVVTTALATGVFPNESYVVASYVYNATEYHTCPLDEIPTLYRADMIRNENLTWLIEALNEKEVIVEGIISESKVANNFAGPRGVFDRRIDLPYDVVGGDPYSTTYPVEKRKEVVEWITNQTIELIKESMSFLKLGKNVFILVDYPEPDWCGHALGPSSLDYAEVVEKIDEEIGRLKRVLEELNIWQNTLMFVLTDHSHADVIPYLNLVDISSDKLHLPDIKVEHIGEFAGGLAHIYLKFPEEDIRDAISSILDKPWLNGIWVREDYYELVQDLPINGTLKNIGLNCDFSGDIIIDIKPPYYASYYSNRGTHGGTATQKIPILIAGGMVITEKLATIQDIRVIDIAPTITAFFGTHMKTAKGKVLEIFYQPGEVSIEISPKIATIGESITVDITYELPTDLTSASLSIDVYNETEHLVFHNITTVTGRGTYETSIKIEEEGIYYLLASIVDNNGKIRCSAFVRFMISKPVEVPQPWEQIYISIALATILIVIMFAIPIVYRKVSR